MPAAFALMFTFSFGLMATASESAGVVFAVPYVLVMFVLVARG